MEFLSWEDVKKTEEYKALSPAGKRAAKKQYPFKEVMDKSMMKAIKAMDVAVTKLLDASIPDNTSELNKIVKCLESLERQVESLPDITIADNGGIENILTQIKSKLSEGVMDTTVTQWDFEFKRDGKGFIKNIEANAIRTLN